MDTFADKISPLTRSLTHAELKVTDDVVGLRSVMVNVFFIDIPASEGGGWVLVDAGLPISGHAIRQQAMERYPDSPSARAILLTHGHFDHTGVLKTLAEEWGIPVYAHPLEHPYLNGSASYAPPDPWVGGGMSLTSPLYPRGPVDVSNHLMSLPEDGSVPFLPEWRWIHTPGHSPGHVSFFRERDRVLIAGDAFVTTKQESMAAVATQAQAIHGPPPYFTHDWQAAEKSVVALANLRPFIAATGHGTPMAGPRLERQLDELADNFQAVAVPTGGRYSDQPVVYGEAGPESVPPPKPIPTIAYVAAGAAAVLALSAVIGVASMSHSDSSKRS